MSFEKALTYEMLMASRYIGVIDSSMIVLVAVAHGIEWPYHIT